MSEASSDNRSLFRIDLERALEALALNLQKKSNAVKNIVPYCHDISNALDGLVLIDLSQAANELAQVFKDAKTVQAHRHVLDDFQGLIRYQLEMIDSQSTEQNHQELLLRKQAFFSKLHIIQPSPLTLEFIRQDIQEAIIQDAVLDSELTQSASEVLNDLEQQLAPQQDQELSTRKKLYSVQDLLNQELQKSSQESEPTPSSINPPVIENWTEQAPAEEKDATNNQDLPIQSPLVSGSHHVFDDLEKSIHELGERLLRTELSPTNEPDAKPQEESIASQEEVDEPFYIDFPYSNKAHELSSQKEVFSEPTTNQDVSRSGSSEEEPTENQSIYEAESAKSDEVTSHQNEVSFDPVSSPLEDSFTGQNSKLSQNEVTTPIEQEVQDQVDEIQEVQAVSYPDATEDTRLEVTLETIEDPFAELDKLSEQFSMAAHQEHIQPSRSIEPPQVMESKVVDVQPASFLTEEESDSIHPMNEDVITLADVHQVTIEPHIPYPVNIPEVPEVTLESRNEPVVGNKTLSSLDDWVDHSAQVAVEDPPNELIVQRGNYHASDFDVQRSLNKLQQARGLLPKDSSFQMKVLDGLIEEQQNMIVQSVQVNVGSAFRGLAELVESDQVFADQNIIERLLSILSIFPAQKHISVVQQRLLIFIDLHGVMPSDEQLHTANNYLAQICGSLEIKSELIRITVPSSLLRMEMFCYKRDEDIYAVPTSQLVEAHQYTHDDVLPESTLWDVHGSIDGPHHRISVRSGIMEHQIYSFETMGSKILNIFEEFPESINKPIWLGAVGIDGQNQFYHCVFLERFAS